MAQGIIRNDDSAPDPTVTLALTVVDRGEAALAHALVTFLPDADDPVLTITDAGGAFGLAGR